MAISKNVCSPVTLNNKGVVLLEAGKCEEAARYFKKASKIMMSVIVLQQARKKGANGVINSVTNETQSTTPSKTPAPTVDRTTDATTASSQSSKRKGVPQPCPESSLTAQPPQKRRRRSSMASSAVPQRVLGRPLWVQSKDERKSPLDSATLSATLLYNLGLAFHGMAANKSKSAATPLFNRALELYTMCREIMLRGPVSNAIQSPVYVVTLHNICQLHFSLEDQIALSKHQGELANVLRLMGASHSICEKHYEEFYIKLLSLPKPTAIAEAA